MYGVEGVFPVNDEECGGLFVQEKILTHEAPEGEPLRVRRGMVGLEAECLDVADGFPLHREETLEGRTRVEAAIVIDGENALAQLESRLRMSV